MPETAAPNSFIERQKEAALAEARERADEHRRISDLILGKSRIGRHVTEIVKLGDDHLAAVRNGGDIKWTFVIAGKASNWYHRTQEEAILHLIASRYDANPNTSPSAAFFAGRVLGLPEKRG